MDLEGLKERRLRIEMIIKIIEDDIEEIDEWLKDKRTSKDKFVLKKKKVSKNRALQRKKDELMELDEEIQQKEMRNNMRGMWN